MPQNDGEVVIQIMGDNSEFASSLKETNRKMKDFGGEINEINKSLQFNPGNSELITQKYTALGQQVAAVRERLEALKNAEAEITAMLGSGEISLSQYDAYRREILNTEAALRGLISAQEDVKTELTLTVAPKIDIPDIGTVLDEKISEVLNNSSAEINKLDERLSQINKSLQLNPGNTELLAQKYTALGQQISVARNKLESLKNIEQQINQSFSNGEIGTEQYDSYRRSVLNAEASLRQLIDAQNDMVDEAGNLHDVSKEVNNLDDAMDDAGKSAITFGDLLKSNIAGEFITEGLHKAADAVKDFIGNSIELASNLQEVQNVVDVTFGDGAAQIYEWSNAAAESYGMSSLSAQSYNGTMGAMLKSMGLADDAVIKMSTDMVGLAGDMASFYNLDVEQAFEKIRSGISGETEPLKQLGINMSVANLEAYALSQGIETAYEKMSQSEQAILRYNYLMSVTADAQGDFARTSDSFANQQRIMQLNIENLSASLGEKLLPHLNDVIVTLNEKLPKAERSIENIGEILGKVTSFALEHHEAILGLASAYLTYQGAMKAGKGISDIVGAFKNLTSVTKTATAAQQGMNAAAAANPYVLLASAIAAVTVGLIALSAASDETSTKLKDAAEQSVADYEEQCDKVSELEDELKGVRDRIEEIQSKGTLSITDETELDNLRQQNGELENQLELEKEILRVKNKQKSDDSLKALYAYTGEGSLNNLESALDDYKRAVEAGSDDINEKENDLLTALTDSQELAGYLDLTSESAAHASDEVDNLKNQIYELIGISPEKENTDSINYTAGSYLNSDYENQYNAEKEAAEKEQKIRDEALQNYVADLDKKLKLRQTSEDQYYSDLKNHLEKYKDTESEVWFDQLERCEDYEAKKLEKAKKAAEEDKKIAEETAKKQKELDDKEIEDEISALKEKQELNDDFTEEMMYNEMETIISGLDKESDLYKKYNSEILKGRKKLADEQAKIIKDGAEEQSKELSDAYDDIKKQKEQVRDELLDIDLMDTAKDKNGNDVDILTDLNAESKKIDKYENSLARLKKTGISDSLLEKIKGMNYEDGSRQRFIDSLLGLSPDKLKLYYDDWKKYQAKAAVVSENDISVSEDIENLNEKTSESVHKMFDDIAGMSYEDGLNTAKKYLQGIYEGMDGAVDPSLIPAILSGNFSVSGSAAGKSENGSAAGAKTQKVVSWDTPITFVFENKKYTSTVGNLIDEGRRTGGNVLKL